ncbi:MAG: hypothetical protein P8Y45_10100 [Exilibacterium sp.]
MRTLVLDGKNKSEKRQEILKYFHKTFSLYESLFDCLNGNHAFYANANPLRHPLIFYYGHTAVFSGTICRINTTIGLPL